MKTYAERLAAGLAAEGWVPVKTMVMGRRAFARGEQKLFVGPTGAVRRAEENVKSLAARPTPTKTYRQLLAGEAREASVGREMLGELENL